MNTPPTIAESFLGLEWPKEVKNFKTGELYFLSPALQSNRRTNDEEKLVRLCNEPLIYDFLFKDNLGGKPYELDYAKGFLSWAHEGWASSSYFVFLLRDSGHNPLGCIDIKQADREESEIGYWCSEQASGLVTNAVGLICELTESLGFKKLRASTLTSNIRSQMVLTRNGFTFDRSYSDLGSAKRAFSKDLRTQK